MIRDINFSADVNSLINNSLNSVELLSEDLLNESSALGGIATVFIISMLFIVAFALIIGFIIKIFQGKKPISL